jgi:hypothetical protein
MQDAANPPASPSAGRVKGAVGEADDRSEAKITLDAPEHGEMLDQRRESRSHHETRTSLRRERSERTSLTQ